MPDLALIDAVARQLAVTTFDQNVVVTASAGTGKTRLLVDRLVQLGLSLTHPVPLPEIVAVTFTEKAANDMKARLRGRLLELVVHPESEELSLLSASEIRSRVEAALSEIERSQIGTIHSFAAHLIRLYPIEAGVDPRFAPDEGRRFEQHFDQEWREWLNRELGSRSERADLWKQVLRGTRLDRLRELAKKLVNDLVPLQALAGQFEAPGLSPVLRHWLERNRERTSALLAGGRHGGKQPRQVENLLAAAQRIFEQVLTGGAAAVREMESDTLSLLRDKQAGSSPPGEWDDMDFEDAKSVIATAKALCETDHRHIRAVMGLLIPFAEACRRRFLERGFVGFDGLLARARDLLKDHPEIRRQLKQQFKAILVDEFQDTDPVQYEILLFLSERIEDSARCWQDVRLQPGKLFIVGDPKQSIFAFRRADIEAFQQVTERVMQQGGLAVTLITNFRSHKTILATVNGMFERLIIERPGLQPAYHALEPQPERKTGADVQGVELRLVVADDDSEDGEELNAERAVRSEAEAIARWLKADVIGKAMLVEADGRRRKVEPGDVAILFRTFHKGREYLDALRRHGLPYIAEAEKHFYQRQEVVDFVNLLRGIQNPDDAVARLGLLRSPIGGLTDHEIVRLTELGAQDYRAGRHLHLDQHPKADHLHRLFAVLQSLHLDCPRRPLPEAVDLIFERLPVLELAAASLHGEQAVANLWKVRAITEELANEPGLTLAGLVALVSERIADPPEESESGLAEETSESVRVMTIHKAKGLEFPIVVLVGLQSGTPPQRDPIQVHHDWSTGVVGVRFEGVSTLEGVFVEEKFEARMAAERRRLLYVAMTRAKERLVLSGAVTRRRTSGNFLDLCREAIGEDVGRLEEASLTVGEGRISQVILPAEESKLRYKQAQDGPTRAHHPDDFESRWHARQEGYIRRCGSSAIITPSSLATSLLLGEKGQGIGRVLTPDLSSLLGSLVHTVLQDWTYDVDHHGMLELCEAAVRRQLPVEFHTQRDDLCAELRNMLMAFASSEAYAELGEATILGREVPLLMPCRIPSHDMPCLVEGRIDVIYEKDGCLWVADYKTDRVTAEEVGKRAEIYREQARLYLQAVCEGLGQEPAGFKVIFVRLGKMVPVLV